MKNKIKTTSFWLGVCGIIVVIADNLSGIMGIKNFSNELNNILLSVCSILVLFGVITKKDISDLKELSEEELLDEINKKDNDK